MGDATNYVDLSSMFNLQKDMILINGLPNPNINTINSSISTGLNNFYNNYVSSNAIINDTLDHQQDMINIVNKEKARLDLKKSEIDSAYTGKQRAMILNESYSLRYKQILKIILVIIITLILFIIIIFISNNFPFLPAFIFELLSIFVISSGIIIVYYLIVSLLSRSNVYYNELNLPPPGIVGNALPTSSTNSSIFDDLTAEINSNMCIGSSCCNTGTKWDSGNSLCVGNTISSFSTIQLSQTNGEFNNKVNVMPNSPNEFSDYTPIKTYLW